MAPKSLLDKSFKYTPVRDQGPTYLADKFKTMLEKQKETAANVKTYVRAKLK